MSPLSIGLDLGGTHIRAVAFDDELAAVARASAPTGAEEGVEPPSRAWPSACGGLGPEELHGVGVGAAGLTDRRTGTVLLASNLGWRDVPLRDLLSAALGGARVDVDKDTNVAALAEARLGRAARCATSST